MAAANQNKNESDSPTAKECAQFNMDNANFFLVIGALFFGASIGILQLPDSFPIKFIIVYACSFFGLFTVFYGLVRFFTARSYYRYAFFDKHPEDSPLTLIKDIHGVVKITILAIIALPLIYGYITKEYELFFGAVVFISMIAAAKIYSLIFESPQLVDKPK